MSNCIDHIAVVVKDLTKSTVQWKSLFGLQETGSETIPARGVDLVKLAFENGPAIELAAPLGENSPISKFLENRGEGIHHICFKVPDIEKAIAELKSQDVKFIQEQAVVGAEGSRIIFMHPSVLNGVLIELKEQAESAVKT